MKSMLAQRFAVSVADGKPWLGFNTPADGASVFYLQSEIPHRLLQTRLRKMLRGTNGRLKKELIIWTNNSIKLDSPIGYNMLEKKLEKHQSQVLIVDPVYKVLTGDMNEQGQISGFLDNMDRLIDKTGVTVLLVSHSRKAISDTDTWGTDDMLGSVFFSAWPDSVIQVARDHQLLTVKFDVVRNAEREIDPVYVNVDAELQFDKMQVKLK